jgi:hypothetical protein
LETNKEEIRIDRKTEKQHARPHRSDCRLGWGLGSILYVNPSAQARSPQINVYQNSTYNRLDLQKHCLKDARIMMLPDSPSTGYIREFGSMICHPIVWILLQAIQISDTFTISFSNMQERHVLFD